MASPPSGNFSIEDCTITSLSTGNSVNVRYLIEEINVFEDIFSNSVNGDMVIVDTLNNVKYLPIYGFETLSLSFKTHGQEIYTIKARIYKISKRKTIQNNSETYVLHFSSQEEVTNKCTRVSKAYVGMPISSIVSDIQSSYLNSTLQNCEGSKYPQWIIVPNMSPFDAIRLYLTEDISGSNNSSSYVYYANKYGYQYLTVESLVAQQPETTYLYQPNNANPTIPPPVSLSSTYSSDQAAVENFYFDSLMDTFQKLHMGMYGSNLKTYNTTYKTYQSIDFLYNSPYYTAHTHLHPNTAYNPVTQQSGYTFLEDQSQSLVTPNAVQRFFPTRLNVPGEFPPHHEEGISERISHMQQIHNSNLNFIVPGDSRKTVGKVVSFMYPSPESLQNNIQQPDQYYSGNYLIMSCRHMITKDKYLTQLSLSRDSMPVPFP